MRSYYLILLVLNIFLLQVSGIKLKKKKQYKRRLDTNLIECMADWDTCVYRRDAYEEFRDRSGVYAGVEFVCSKNLQGVCLYNATYSYEYGEDVRDNNVPDYIKETDTSNRFNQYANEGETGSKEESVDETGSNEETIDETGSNGETVEETGSNEETIDETGSNGETEGE